MMCLSHEEQDSIRALTEESETMKEMAETLYKAVAKAKQALPAPILRPVFLSAPTNEVVRKARKVGG